MSVNIHHRVADEPRTYYDLVRFWQSVDEPLTADELHQLWHPRTPNFIVAARCVFAFIVLSTLACLPTALRVVGRALE